MHAYTVGHGIRPLEELIETLREAGVGTLVDVRRFPGSRRNPQFNQDHCGPLSRMRGSRTGTRSSSAAA